MANTIEIKLLENKRAHALINGYPYALEGNYHIVAGEDKATEFVISSAPTQYAECSFKITGYNAAKEEVLFENSYTIGEKFFLPLQMAYAGYSQLNIQTSYHDEIVKWLPVKLKIWKTSPDWTPSPITKEDILQDQIDTLKGQMDDLETSVPKQNEINDIKDKITALETSIPSSIPSQEEIDTINENIDAIQEQIANLQTSTPKKEIDTNSEYLDKIAVEGGVKITINDSDITDSCQIELYPADTTTETYLAGRLNTNIITVSNGKGEFILNGVTDPAELPVLHFYYLIFFVKGGAPGTGAGTGTGTGNEPTSRYFYVHNITARMTNFQTSTIKYSAYFTLTIINNQSESYSDLKKVFEYLSTVTEGNSVVASCKCQMCNGFLSSTSSANKEVLSGYIYGIAVTDNSVYFLFTQDMDTVVAQNTIKVDVSTINSGLFCSDISYAVEI